MPKDHVGRFADQVAKGFAAVGCRIPVARDGETVVSRDIFAEFGPGISLFKASEPDAPFMSFPEGAGDSAATAFCMHILAGVVARAVEATE